MTITSDLLISKSKYNLVYAVFSRLWAGCLIQLMLSCLGTIMTGNGQAIQLCCLPSCPVHVVCYLGQAQSDKANAFQFMSFILELMGPHTSVHVV